VIAELLEDAELVAAGRCSAIRNTVLGPYAVCRDESGATGRVGSGVGRANVVVRLDAMDRFANGEPGNTSLLEVSLIASGLLSEPDSRSDVVDVLLDVTRNVILLTSDISMSPGGTVLPHVEVRVQKILSLFDWGIKLDPLQSISQL